MATAETPCDHLVYDEGRARTCLICGATYDRVAILERLRETIHDRYRLPPSPWSGAERAADPW